jgi:hypothetical protein
MRNVAFSLVLLAVNASLVHGQVAVPTTRARPRPAAAPGAAPAAPPATAPDAKKADDKADKGSDKEPVKSTAPVPSPLDVEVVFADGSLVKVVLLDTKVDIVTRYGKLQVPLSEVRRIELGVRYPEGSLQKIQDAITRLSDADYKKREAAQKELIDFGELAYPLVRRVAATSSNLEAAKRAKTIATAIRDKIPEEKQTLKDQDTITTYDFTISGHIDGPSFKARSPLLGDVDVKLIQARTIRWLGTTSEAKIKLDGARYGAQGETWLDTNIEVNGDKIQITAEGTVDLMPQNPNQIMAGPEGNRQNGVFRRGGTTFGVPGALVAKIGNGQPFLVGPKYEGTPKGDGKLMLKIDPSPWGQMSGAFDITIVTGK